MFAQMLKRDRERNGLRIASALWPRRRKRPRVPRDRGRYEAPRLGHLRARLRAVRLAAVVHREGDCWAMGAL